MKYGVAAGPKEESLFGNPLAIIAAGLPNELPELFKEVDELNDDRLLALVTALIVEERLDKLLASFCPKYQKITEETGFTFSMKIRLLEALNFIPLGITEAAHIVRNIRNDFAHKLESKQFSNLDNKIIRKTEAFLKRPNYADEKLDESASFRSKFTRVASIAIVGLNTYMGTFLAVRAKISENGFQQEIIREDHEKFDTMITGEHLKGPRLILRDEGKFLYVYEKHFEVKNTLPEPCMVPVFDKDNCPISYSLEQSFSKITLPNG